MILAFPRAWLVLLLWGLFIVALDAPVFKITRPILVYALAAVTICVAMGFWEDQRWTADVSGNVINGAVTRSVPG